MKMFAIFFISIFTHVAFAQVPKIYYRCISEGEIESVAVDETNLFLSPGMTVQVATASLYGRHNFLSFVHKNINIIDIRGGEATIGLNTGKNRYVAYLTLVTTPGDFDPNGNLRVREGKMESALETLQVAYNKEGKIVSDLPKYVILGTSDDVNFLMCKFSSTPLTSSNTDFAEELQEVYEQMTGEEDD